MARDKNIVPRRQKILHKRRRRKGMASAVKDIMSAGGIDLRGLPPDTRSVWGDTWGKIDGPDKIP